MAFSFVAGMLGFVGTHYRGSVLAVSMFLVLVQALPLWLRRSRPVLVLVLIVLAEIAQFVLAPFTDRSGPALIFAVYAVSVYDRSPVRLWVAGAAITFIVVPVFLLFLGDFPGWRSFIPVGALSLVAWVIGDYVRSRRRFFTELVARHQQAREQAAEEERLRIARELHDVVAHNVSVMAIQAGAARVSGDPDKEALRSIESAARDTIAELNRLVGVLRKQPEAPLAPQPGLDQVEALLKVSRDSGLEATLSVSGEKRALPAALDLTAYRIVQEAITNTLKHANASRLEVRLSYLPDALEITIRDNGRGESEDAVKASTGHGLIGMRERVALFGGDLEAGSTAVGGFTVRSKLPIA